MYGTNDSYKFGDSVKGKKTIRDYIHSPTDEEEKNGFQRISNNTILIQKNSVSQDIYSRDITERSSDSDLGDLFERWLGGCLGCLNSNHCSISNHRMQI
jgi:hypothetical protein